jgi:hypothetical protein
MSMPIPITPDRITEYDGPTRSGPGIGRTAPSADGDTSEGDDE